MHGLPVFLERRVAELLDDVAARTPAPGGGSVAAIVVALAAGLVEMAARFSDACWGDAEGAAAQARALRLRAAPLGQEDADAYLAVLRARRLPRESDSVVRDRALGQALEAAAAVPLEIAEVAAEVATLAAAVVESGNPNLRGDCAAGAALAEAGARIGANLVAINLGVREGDERLTRARVLVGAASDAARRALAPGD